MNVIVIRRSDGQYFLGCGYEGPGKLTGYWTDEIRRARVFMNPTQAYTVMRRHGGYRGAAELGSDGRPARWRGFIVYRYRGWAIVDDDPRNFDPNDYEGNNGPIVV